MSTHKLKIKTIAVEKEDGTGFAMECEIKCQASGTAMMHMIAGITDHCLLQLTAAEAEDNKEPDTLCHMKVCEDFMTLLAKKLGERTAEFLKKETKDKHCNCPDCSKKDKTQ